MTFGQRVRALRTGLGLSQRDLAMRLGVRRATVSVWESGRATEPGSAALGLRLAEVLHVDPYWLILGRYRGQHLQKDRQ